MSDDKNKGYFDLSKALDEVRHESFGAKDTTVAGLKLFGKGLFNAARFAVTEVIPAAVEQTAAANARTSKKMLKRDDLTDEQRSRFEEIRDKSEDFLKTKEQERREQEAMEAEATLEREFAEAREAAERARPEYRDTRPEAPSEPSTAAQARPAETNDSADSVPAPVAEPAERIVQAQARSAATVAAANPASTADSAQVTRSAGDAISPGIVARRPGEFADRPPELTAYVEVLEGVHERIYVGERIPKNKLENALKGRGEYFRKGKALLLVDDTVMGGGKDGLLVTDEYISFKAAFSDSHDYGFNFARQLTVPDGFKFHLIPSDATAALLDRLRTFFVDRRQWHERAAEDGNRDSQFFLSFQYESADERGPYWLIRAAQAGHATAQHNLAMEFKGSNRALAIHWFELAAAQGHENAAKRLADLQRAAIAGGEAAIPKGATRLIDLMSPQAVRDLEQNISDSRQAMGRALRRIADEDRC